MFDNSANGAAKTTWTRSCTTRMIRMRAIRTSARWSWIG